MRLHKLPAALFAVVAALALLADIPVTQNSATLATSNQVLATHCGGGQSMAVIQALATTIPGPTPTPSPTPPATPTPGPTSTPIAWSGTITIYTAADLSNQPGPSASPFNITPANSTSYTQTITSAPGKLYVTLASDQWVLAQLTTATTGVVPVTVTCSGSVARVTVPGASAAPTICPSAGQAVSVTGSYPCTINVDISPASGGGGVALQAANATPTPQTGTAGLTDGLWVLPASGTPTPIPAAIRVSTPVGSGTYATWGTNGCSVQGVNGQILSLSNSAGSCLANFDSNGDLGTNGSLKVANNLAFSSDPSVISWPGSSSTSNPCEIVGHSGAGEIVLLPSSTGTCALRVESILGPAPVCANASGQLIACAANWDTTVCAGETSVTHCYPMNDAPGCAQIADAATATAAPSPVPLPTPTTASTITCGAPSISHDTEKSVLFSGTAASGYLVLPHSILPASGSFSVELVQKGSLIGAVAVGTSSVSDMLVAFDSSCSDFCIAHEAQANLNFTGVSHWLQEGSTTARDFDTNSTATNEFLLYTWDGTHSDFYVNCDLVSQTTNAPLYSATAGALGVFPNSGTPSDPWQGRLAKFAIANTAFSQAKCLTHLAALGL